MCLMPSYVRNVHTTQMFGVRNGMCIEKTSETTDNKKMEDDSQKILYFYAPFLLLFAADFFPSDLPVLQDHVKSSSPILAGYSSHSLHSNGNIVLTDGGMADMEASSTLMVRQYVENIVRTSSPSPSRPMRYTILFALM